MNQSPGPAPSRLVRGRPQRGMSAWAQETCLRVHEPEPPVWDASAVTDRSVAWAADTWRAPAWLWLGGAAMAVALLHILLDMGVGLFDMQGRLSMGVGSVLVVIVLIHFWWMVSFVAGAQGGAAASSAWQF